MDVLPYIWHLVMTLNPWNTRQEIFWLLVRVESIPESVMTNKLYSLSGIRTREAPHAESARYGWRPRLWRCLHPFGHWVGIYRRKYVNINWLLFSMTSKWPSFSSCIRFLYLRFSTSPNTSRNSTCRACPTKTTKKVSSTVSRLVL